MKECYVRVFFSSVKFTSTPTFMKRDARWSIRLGRGEKACSRFRSTKGKLCLKSHKENGKNNRILDTFAGEKSPIDRNLPHPSSLYIFYTTPFLLFVFFDFCSMPIPLQTAHISPTYIIVPSPCIHFIRAVYFNANAVYICIHSMPVSVSIVCHPYLCILYFIDTVVTIRLFRSSLLPILLLQIELYDYNLLSPAHIPLHPCPAPLVYLHSTRWKEELVTSGKKLRAVRGGGLVEKTANKMMTTTTTKRNVCSIITKKGKVHYYDNDYYCLWEILTNKQQWKYMRVFEFCCALKRFSHYPNGRKVTFILLLVDIKTRELASCLWEGYTRVFVK